MKIASFSLLSTMAVFGLLPAEAARVESTRLDAALELVVYRGLSGERVDLQTEAPVPLSIENGGEYRAYAGDFEVRGELIPGSEVKLGEWRAEFRNTGTSRLLLEPVLRWSVGSIGPEAIYWNGTSEVRPVAALPVSEAHDAIRRMAPWAAFADNGQAVMAGLHPLDLRSYIAKRWEREEGNGPAAIEFVTRIVLEPGQTVPVVFLFGEFPVEYGLERELVQRVHDTVPGAFHPNPKAHPSLYGVSSHYWSSRVPADRIPASAVLEFLRRYHATWDWSYAPFKRTGDYWGHDDLWEYEPNIPFRERRSSVVQQEFHFSDITRDDFFAMRKRHYNSNRGRDGLYFFTPGGVWVEKTLAEERYADALTVDENYRYELTQWVTGHDREVKVLPWYTSYEKVLKADWQKIVETYDICGVALDVCRGGPRYRGPAAEKPIESRAWDEQGVFIDQGVAIAKYIEFLHTLPVRHSPGNVLAIYGNPETSGATYMTVARYDGGMFEGPPYHPNHSSLPLQRYMLGQKPLTWWSGWLYDRYGVPNYQAYDKEHFIRTMQGLADYVIFRSFELGGLPTLNYQHGVPKITEIVPDLIAAVQLGWQAVVPVRFEFGGKLHTARYGKELDTLLFYGNPYEEDDILEVEINGGRLGEGQGFLFASWRGAEEELHNVLRGTDTHIAFMLSARDPILHRVVAAVENPQDLTATVQLQRDLYGVFVTLDIKEAGDGEIHLTLPEYEGYHLVSVRSSGKPVEWSREGRRIILPGLLPVDGALALDIQYRSPWLHLTRGDVESFRLLDDTGSPVFNIVLSGPDQETEMAAEKLRQYAAFYAAVTQGRKNIEIARYQEGEVPKAGGGSILLKVDPEAGEAGVRLSGPGNILVQGRSARELEEALGQLLLAFDEFHPFSPGFRSTWGMTAPVLNHVGMEGRVLPPRKQ